MLIALRCMHCDAYILSEAVSCGQPAKRHHRSCETCSQTRLQPTFQHT